MNERKQFDPAPLLPASDDWIAREEGNRLVYILRERNGQSALDILVRAEYEDFGITRGHLEAIIEELGYPID